MSIELVTLTNKNRHVFFQPLLENKLYHKEEWSLFKILTTPVGVTEAVAAYDNGVPVGVVVCLFNTFLMTFVAAQARRKGVGQALIKGLVKPLSTYKACYGLVGSDHFYNSLRIHIEGPVEYFFKLEDRYYYNLYKTSLKRIEELSEALVGIEGIILLPFYSDGFLYLKSNTKAIHCFNVDKNKELTDIPSSALEACDLITFDEAKLIIKARTTETESQLRSSIRSNLLQLQKVVFTIPSF